MSGRPVYERQWWQVNYQCSNGGPRSHTLALYRVDSKVVIAVGKGTTGAKYMPNLEEVVLYENYISNSAKTTAAASVPERVDLCTSSEYDTESSLN